MKHRTILFLTFLIAATVFPILIAATVPVEYKREVYISSEGCDTNPGTIDKPRKTFLELPDNFHINTKKNNK